MKDAGIAGLLPMDELWYNELDKNCQVWLLVIIYSGGS